VDERLARALGALSALGGALAVVAAVPTRWYGVPQTDAYLFDPPLFSPLWVERTVIPLVAVVAGLLFVVAIGALVVRDRAVAGRLRRWGGYVAVAGLALLGVAVVGLAATGAFGGGIQTTGALVALLALLVALVGLGLALPALVAMGVGYARTERPAVGYALFGGPVLTGLATGVAWMGVSTGIGSLPLVVPFAATFVGVGYELWSRPAPVPEPGGHDSDPEEPATADGGAADGGTSDGGTSDGGTSDAGTSDGGAADGGTSDGGPE